MEKEKIRRLVLQAGQGDRAAFGELYEETGRSVYFNCLKLLGNAQQAEDITQDTFMKALEKLDSLKEPENFSAWVNRIAINNCKMYFRKNPRTAEDESEKIIDDTPDSELIPDDYADSEEKRRIIMNIIDTALTDEQRQTIILFYFDMMSVAEIAEIMECSVGTVTSRLSAARKKIREAVLIYEKKNNDRLHAVMPIPVLSKIFMQECQHLKLPELSVFSKASATEVVPDKNTTISKSGGKGMFSTVKAKVIAGVVVLAVVGGGITAAVLANRDKTADADKLNTAVQTDAQGEVNEQEIENKLNELDENTDNEDDVTGDAASGVDSDGEPEMAVYTVSDEIKNADLSSGLVQLNGDIMQVGGYIKTSDFYAKYADEYSFVYCDGGHYEDKKGEMLNYRVGADNYFGGEWWDSYYMTLIPKVEPQGDSITVYVANLTNPDGQVSLADSYVVWAEETPMSKDIYTPAWIPTGMPTRLCYDVTSTKKLDEIYDNIDDYSAQSVQDMLASQGISKGDNSISGNYLFYVYSQGDMSMDGTYCVNSDTAPDVFVAYVAGEKNAAGLTPLYRYHFAFDTNSKKLYESRMYLAGMF
ncbi:RNA polymerase sigma factor [Ruminococcus sp.]|uniref:RNA polymerase sigma factor n=1 Tax=Ruminococcus sp. TaxID=41978 RepID=UPI002E785769|nr:sigma-70 family RNA polymerase sigma factor [Ruminococcus sp.]MEE0046084.1 sigma-70 family RNA polymerase sigma factor [Ruminococcus sp.]